MQLSEVCIKRPVFATVLSLLVMLVGLVSYNRLTVREYPKIDEPVVTVETRYRGASPEIIESQVTKPLEDSIAGIEGVDVLTSISRTEQSQITVRFKLTRDADSSAADVRDRVARVRQRLPSDIDEPVIAKVEADASPIIWLALTSTQHSMLEISDYANRIVKPKLQTLPGVSNVFIPGERRYAMRIELESDKLAAQGLTAQDIEDALRRQNVEIPAGRIESVQREFSVVSQTDLNTPEQFANVVVRSVNGSTIRLGDIANVKLGAASERSVVRFNRDTALGMGLIRQATANPLDVANALRKELPNLDASLPTGMKMNVANDLTVFIDQAIKNVYRTIFEAVVLVAAVIFFFLRSWRAAFIPLVTIPVSLIGAFALMLLFGFSINTLTLLALVLAIGLVVDDAIVVLENIYRHIEEGMQPMAAAIKGMREISFAVVAMTLTLAAVFVPLAFAPGRTGRLFVEFALALAGAVVVSGFVALTLSPMMSSRLLKAQATHGKLYNAIERLLNAVNSGYMRSLNWSLKHRWVTVLVVLGVAVGTTFAFMGLKRELSPTEDRGTVLAIFSAPEGASIDYTAKYAKQIEEIAARNKEVDRLFVLSGNPTVTQGIAFFRMTPWGDREKSAMQLQRELFPQLSQIPGVLAFASVPASLGQNLRERPVNVVITSSDTYEQMNRNVQAVVAELSKNPRLQQIDTDLRLNRPELRVQVDRERAADAGVQIDVVGRTLETMLGGRQVTRFKREGEQYDVIVQLRPDARNSADDISSIYVRNRDGQMVSLASIVKVNDALAPRDLNHFSQRRSVTISASLAPGYSQGEGVGYALQVAQQMLKDKPGYAIDLTGASREFKESGQALLFVFVLALAFIYLVLAAQFESFKDPFIIMLTVPLGMLGALLALLITGGSLNVYSQIGLVALIGLITKNGILLVEFSNQLQEQGRAFTAAILESAQLRLRPILMTSLATIFGAIPLAIATGAGAESRQQIGWVIVGGMAIGTLLTLYVIPVMYSLLATHIKPHAYDEALAAADAADAAVGSSGAK